MMRTIMPQDSTNNKNTYTDNSHILNGLKEVLALKDKVTPEEWQEFIDFWKVRFTDEDRT